MQGIRAIIVDDEGLARDTLHLLLQDHADVTVVRSCENGREAVAAIKEESPDLVFLDIQMPEMNGFDVIEAIGPEKMPVVIFVTAYDQYALRAFDAQALDYLLKPFDDDRFEHALKRARTLIKSRKVGALGAQLAALVAGQDDPVVEQAAGDENAYMQRVMVKSRDSVYFVKVDDIEWIEAAGDYISINAGGKAHLIRETMAGILKKLDPASFVRIHRSSIVCIDCIKELKPYFHGDYIVMLKSGKELRLSRRYWDQLEKTLRPRN